MKQSTPLFVLFVMFSSGLAYAWHAHAYGVSWYDGTGECASNGMGDVYLVSSYLNTWDYAMKYRFTRTYTSDKIYNQNVRYSWLVNADYLSPYGADTADTVLFKGHGTSYCYANYGETNYRLGYSGQQCTATMSKIASVNELELGDYNTNVLVSLSCLSAQYCVWENEGYNNLKGGAQLFIYNGFHGEHYTHIGDVGNFSDYLGSSNNDEIGLAWVTEMTQFNITGHPSEDDDNCASSIAYSSDGRDTARYVYQYGGFSDFKNPAFANGNNYMFAVALCDASEGDGPLPSGLW